ncbi:MAG TPA: ABC transporter substrate-binding protein [Rhodanobacteraceae bacterium]|nr:ABC transporter substrate-binding protein [Rhodanobacteraceae bacterium]
MSRFVRFIVVAVLACVACITAFAAPEAYAQAVQTPQQVVQGIADDLGRAIDGHRDELRRNPDQMIRVIDGILLPHFDIDYASLLVLGRHAREATPEQRVRFAHAFYNSITHRYAEGLLNYTKGSVKVLPADGDLNAKRSVVRTEVMLDDGKSLSVDYVFRKTNSGEWKAYDVVIEGISYVTNYRNQVDAEIQKEGIEGLIKRLESQGATAIDQLQQQAGQ